MLVNKPAEMQSELATMQYFQTKQKALRLKLKAKWTEIQTGLMYYRKAHIKMKVLKAILNSFPKLKIC
jgi:hypothetical protein